MSSIKPVFVLLGIKHDGMLYTRSLPVCQVAAEPEPKTDQDLECGLSAIALCLDMVLKDEKAVEVEDFFSKDTGITCRASVVSQNELGILFGAAYQYVQVVEVIKGGVNLSAHYSTLRVAP
ncbi:hypothetical protein R1sor_014845 [Riccia sorocarpa]|uniref:Uncharacterized protein n=1 Tax=Riccia sorocarpa TaxID=122646 RepID=A0ABD3HCE6_9MARC